MGTHQTAQIARALRRLTQFRFEAVLSPIRDQIFTKRHIRIACLGGTYSRHMNTTKQAPDTNFRRPAGGKYVITVPRHRTTRILGRVVKAGKVPTSTPGNHWSQPRRSICKVSRDYLRREAHLEFLAELLLFALIVAISAWPIFSLADAMSQSVR